MDATQSVEEWLPVISWEGLYEVSYHGRARSLDREIVCRDGQRQFHRSTILKTYPVNRYGHQGVDLVRPGIRRKYLLHRLVAATFIGACPPGMECCHNDGNPSNNRADNLRWDTPSSNQLDRLTHGTHHYGNRDRCSQGHLLEGDNVYYRTRNGGQSRVCRQCKRDNYHRNKRKPEGTL